MMIECIINQLKFEVQMESSSQLYNEIVKQLSELYDSSEAKNIGRILLEDCFQISREDLLIDKNITIDMSLLKECINRLMEHEPIQYVTGKCHFFGREFAVEEGVLIPRPETEELVKLIIDENRLEQPSILDIGTGSGCIAISLALELSTEVHALDNSAKALKVAKRNADSLDTNINFIKSDILSDEIDLSELDILVSNPPYIPGSDKSIMHQNVLEFEPEEALFVNDSNPLIFYERIAHLGKQVLKPSGKLYFELHENFAKQVEELVTSFGYHSVTLHKDLQGKNRMLSVINLANR